MAHAPSGGQLRNTSRRWRGARSTYGCDPREEAGEWDVPESSTRDMRARRARMNLDAHSASSRYQSIQARRHGPPRSASRRRVPSARSAEKKTSAARETGGIRSAKGRSRGCTPRRAEHRQQDAARNRIAISPDDGCKKTAWAVPRSAEKQTSPGLVTA